MRSASARQPRERLAPSASLLKRARTASAAVATIRAGVPVKLVERLAAKLEVPRGQIFALLGVAERTAPRRVAAGVLKPVESDRFYRLDRIVALAQDAIGDAAKARGWMKRSNRALGGETPLEFLDTEAGAQEVENLLQQIKHGLFT